MVEDTTDDSDSRPEPPERYRYNEYERADGSVAVIQDGQNEDAWVRSTLAVAVER